MPEITVVTTFNSSGLEKYGREFIASFDRNWDPSVDLFVYSEGFDLDPPSGRVSVIDLPSASRNLVVFKGHYSKQPQATGRMDGGYNYNFDAVRFSHKMFAMFDARRRAESRFLVWLDGDVETRRSVPSNFIADLMKGDVAVAYLGRNGMHSETGFLCFDLSHPEMAAFFQTMERIYLSGEIFNLNAWHDCEVFDVTRTVFAAQGKIKSRNLSAGLSVSDPFLESVLGSYMTHFKGDQKGLTTGLMRYDQIGRLIDLVRPRLLVEVGTWNGGRAVQMAGQALKHRVDVEYIGFDLFEDGSPETDARERNGKSRVRFDEVERRLSTFANLNAGFTSRLVQGDTRTSMFPIEADFAFIDGGHSVETIASDFGNLIDSKLIVLDDYYLGGVDTEQFGCNKVIAEHPHRILPAVDTFDDGTQIALAVVADPLLLNQIDALLGRH